MNLEGMTRWMPGSTAGYDELEREARRLDMLSERAKKAGAPARRGSPAGELRCYDVSEPLSPRLKGSVRLGGIASHAAHPKGGEPNGGPQMLEVSRDGKRIYFSNSLYSSWAAQFYPDGIRGWVVKVDALADGGLKLDPDFFIPFEGNRPHQIRLQGGDSSSDSFCFP